MKTSYLLAVILLFAAFYHCQTYEIPSLLQAQVSHARLHAGSKYHKSHMQQASQVSTQTGTTTKVYYQTSSPMQSGAGTLRTDDITIAFSQPFYALPSVAVALQGVDIDHRVPNVKLQVLSVTTSGFIVRVTVKASVALYSVQIGYIATISPQSGIYVLEHGVDAATDSQAGQVLNANNLNAKIVTRSVVPPCFSNVKSTAFLRSFDITPRGNTRLQVYTAPDSTSVSYYTWYDTQLNSAGSTVVFWNGNDQNIKNVNVQSTQNGVLLTGPIGEKKESATFSTKDYSTVPERFYGLYFIDIQAGRNVRIAQDLSGSNALWTLTMSNWYDTQIYQMKTSVVLAPTAVKV